MFVLLIAPVEVNIDTPIHPIIHALVITGTSRNKLKTIASITVSFENMKLYLVASLCLFFFFSPSLLL